MIDSCYQLAYRIGYRLMRQIWRFRRPRHSAALVALWCDGELCLVRPSYRRSWELPGGGIKRGELAHEAARRELHEELGLDLPIERFVEALEIDDRRDYRQDHVTVFHIDLADLPVLKVDNREIIAASFVAPNDARRLWLPSYLSAYLEAHDLAASAGEPA